MGVKEEVERIEKAKSDIRTAIEDKGQPVPADETLEKYPQHIRAIETGAKINDDEVVTDKTWSSQKISDELDAQSIIKPQTLTPKQQSQARTNIGAEKQNKWRLIRKIEYLENAGATIFETDDEGKTFSLNEIKIEAFFPKTGPDKNGYFYILAQGNISLHAQSDLEESQERYVMFYANCDAGISLRYAAKGINAYYDSITQLETRDYRNELSKLKKSGITRLYLGGFSAASTFPKGTTFEVYGRDMND